MHYQQALEVSTQTDSPRESVASKGVGCGAMHAEHIEDTGANMSNAQLEAAERSQLLERENADLQQQLKALESRYDSSRQLLEAQATELAEKTRVIEALQSKLSRLSNLAAAFADEVHGTGDVITGTGMPPYQSLAARQAQQQAAPQQQPALQTSTPGQQLTIPAAMAVLTRLHQQHQHHQQSTSTVAEAAAAAGAAAVAGMRLPSAGSKRARLCSATGSAGDATKHAASGGSSSSHQQLSADEELDEELDDDEGDDYAEATARCFSGKRSRSPRSFEQPADDEAAAAAAAEHMDDEEDVEKSQDELDAVQCLQQLAMSAGAGAGESQGANHTSVPSLVFDSLAHSNRFAAGPNRGAGGNLARWPSSGPTNATHGAAGAAAGYAGSSSSNGSGGNGGNSSTYNHVMQAQLLSYLGAINPEGFEGSHNPRAQQQGAQPVQQKRVSLPFGSAQQPQAAQQQQRQQHNFGGLTMQRSGSLGTSWGPAAKSPAPAAPSGSMGVVARARKQSWFQTEISEKIPLSVQQSCTNEWKMQQCMPVVCADLSGTFYVNSAGEYLIKLAHSGEVVTPNKFEELAGKKTARNWQQSIRLVGFTMNGEPNSALLKLGHFTRIVGLVQDR